MLGKEHVVDGWVFEFLRTCRSPADQKLRRRGESISITQVGNMVRLEIKGKIVENQVKKIRKKKLGELNGHRRHPILVNCSSIQD